MFLPIIISLVLLLANPVQSAHISAFGNGQVSSLSQNPSPIISCRFQQDCSQQAPGTICFMSEGASLGSCVPKPDLSAFAVLSKRQEAAPPGGTPCSSNSTFKGCSLGLLCVNGICQTPGEAVKKLPTWAYVVIALGVILVVVVIITIISCCCGCGCCCCAGRAVSKTAGAGLAVVGGVGKGIAKGTGAIVKAGRSNTSNSGPSGRGNTGSSAPRAAAGREGPAPLPANYRPPIDYFELVETIPEKPAPVRQQYARYPPSPPPVQPAQQFYSVSPPIAVPAPVPALDPYQQRERQMQQQQQQYDAYEQQQYEQQQFEQQQFEQQRYERQQYEQQQYEQQQYEAEQYESEQYEQQLTQQEQPWQQQHSEPLLLVTSVPYPERTPLQEEYRDPRFAELTSGAQNTSSMHPSPSVPRTPPILQQPIPLEVVGSPTSTSNMLGSAVPLFTTAGSTQRGSAIEYQKPIFGDRNSSIILSPSPIGNNAPLVVKDNYPLPPVRASIASATAAAALAARRHSHSHDIYPPPPVGEFAYWDAKRKFHQGYRDENGFMHGGYWDEEGIFHRLPYSSSSNRQSTISSQSYASGQQIREDGYAQYSSRSQQPQPNPKQQYRESGDYPQNQSPQPSFAQPRPSMPPPAYNLNAMYRAPTPERVYPSSPPTPPPRSPLPATPTEPNPVMNSPATTHTNAHAAALPSPPAPNNPHQALDDTKSFNATAASGSIRTINTREGHAGDYSSQQPFNHSKFPPELPAMSIE
ncbi:hypothetical protein DFS34DRAFT_594864 [Phlyctochytrium arcticum]|nr:hypothetical protein DFS34DRAFT_594864 [Phlyctochytrium arcticum]